MPKFRSRVVYKLPLHIYQLDLRSFMLNSPRIGNDLWAFAVLENMKAHCMTSSNCVILELF